MLYKNERGHGLIIVLLVLVQIPILISISSSVLVRKTGMSSKTWDQFVLHESTKSAFILMESALRRRMWEPPPDNQCLRMKDFHVEGDFPNGFKFKVTGNYIPAERMIRLTSVGEKSGTKTEYTKFHKMVDVADYLYLSRNQSILPNDDVVISKASADRNVPAGLVAGSRRIQIGGRLRLESDVIPREDPDISSIPWSSDPFGLAHPTFSPNPPHTFKSYGYNDPKPVQFPEGVGTVIQADKIEIKGGIYYGQNSGPFATVSTPSNRLSSANLRSTTLGFTSTNSWYGQRAGSVAMFTQNYQLAMDQVEAIRTGTATGIATQSSVAPFVYPIALVDTGGFPVQVNGSTPTNGSSFINDILNSTFFFHYNSVAGFTQGHYSCLTSDPWNKPCSASWVFKNAFTSWRTSANLEKSLLVDEAQQINLREIDWDNMDAFQEDAQECGMVISASSSLPTQEDCDISDHNFLKSYAANPTTASCPQVKRLSFNNLGSKLTNFNMGTYTSNAIEDGSHLRRVIYTKVPLELLQEKYTGLWPTLSNNNARNRFSVVIVNEDKLMLKPRQIDLTSPLDTNPHLVRETYFNSDGTNLDPLTRLLPLKMAFITPEDIQILTPQYVYMDLDNVKAMLPVSGGAIRPRRHLLTDFITQENDGFRYGVRNIRLENIALITSLQNQAPAEYLTPVSRPNGFALRGLWAATANSHRFGWYNACMFDNPDGPPPSKVAHMWRTSTPPSARETRVGPSEYYDYAAPNAGAASNTDIIPYVGSRFYNGVTKNEVPPGFLPAVFILQQSHNLPTNASLRFSGAVIRVGFANQTPVGKRNLNIKLYDYKNFVYSNSPGLTLDLNNRYARNDTNNQGLQANPASPPQLSTDPSYAFQCAPNTIQVGQNTGIRTNGGYFVFVNLPLDENFRSLAFLNNLEMPSIITTGN